MSSHAARRRVARRPSRAKVRRRRIGLLAAAVILGAVCAAVVSGLGEDAVREFTLPLHHDDIIRQQAAEKDLDPALIAVLVGRAILPQLGDGALHPAGELASNLWTPRIGRQDRLAVEGALGLGDAGLDRQRRIDQARMDASLNGSAARGRDPGRRASAEKALHDPQGRLRSPKVQG